MQKRDGQGKAKTHTESGEEKAKGGENVQKINREDVVQAALTVERWCTRQDCRECPLMEDYGLCMLYGFPEVWDLEEKLRERGLKHGKS